MANFLEKLKKGMDIKEIPEVELVSNKIPSIENLTKDEEKTVTEDETAFIMPSSIKNKKTKSKKEDINKKTKKKEKKDLSEPIEDKKTIKTKKKKLDVKLIKKDKSLLEPESELSEDKWSGPEGQLVVDVYETNGEIVIQSAIGGIQLEDLDISIEEDMVKIKGVREKTFEQNERNYFYQECHWGTFSREIILPVEVDASRAEAIIKNGILTIRMPKIEKVSKKKIAIKEEE